MNLLRLAWVGSEGDLFRAQLAEIPPHLDTAHSAFGQVGGALDGFADVLAGAQCQMAGVRADAEQAFGSLTKARAERAGLREPTDGEVAVDPSVAAAFQERCGALEARIGRLEAAWEAELAAASGLRLEVLEAARHRWERNPGCWADVPNRRPELDQGQLEKTRRWTSGQLDDLKDFVAERAEVFRGVATALRVVGMALTLVGAGAGRARGRRGSDDRWVPGVGAGDALDSTVDWAKGTISGRELLFQAGRRWC